MRCGAREAMTVGCKPTRFCLRRASAKQPEGRAARGKPGKASHSHVTVAELPVGWQLRGSLSSQQDSRLHFARTARALRDATYCVSEASCPNFEPGRAHMRVLLV